VAAVGADVFNAQMGGMLCALSSPCCCSCDLFDLRSHLKLIKWEVQHADSEVQQPEAASDVEADTAQVTVTNG